MNRHITRKTEAWQQSTWSLPASKSCSWTATSSHRSHYIKLLVIWNLATKWYISLCSDPRSPFALHLWTPCKKSHSGGKTVLNTNFHINTKRFIIYFKKINWFPLERDCKNPKEKGQILKINKQTESGFYTSPLKRNPENSWKVPQKNATKIHLIETTSSLGLHRLCWSSAGKVHPYIVCLIMYLV